MIDSDEYRINSLNRAAMRAEKEHKAVQNAMQRHPVVQYVLNLPYEDPVYPANRYLVFSPRENPQESGLQGIQESQETYSTTPLDASSLHSIPNNAQTLGSTITWCMPGHDFNRPVRKGCGIIRASDGTAVYTQCDQDQEHHLKAKQKHCWSRHCPKCMNDTCIRDAVEVEKRFLACMALKSKEGNPIGWVSHFTVSPPQEFAKHTMQTYEDYNELSEYVGKMLIKHGAVAGYTVFHPWRQKSNRWELAPHFHVLLLGFIDTTSFRNDNPGWVIKKIHARERIRSIHMTVGYLLTHAGIPLVARQPEDVDWDLQVLNTLIPGLTSKGADYTEDDYSDKADNKGKMVGDLSKTDWVQWTINLILMKPRMRYWGLLSQKSIQKIDNIRQYKIRLCKECGTPLRVYQGMSDLDGDYVRYIQDNPVVCFARNASAVKAFILRYKSRLRDENDPLTLEDLVRMIPTAASSLEYIQQNHDLVMSGPFDEPDSYFLKRQAKAIGLGDSTVSA